MNKRSSIKSCLVESWKAFATHPGIFLKYLWFHLFMAGVGFAFLSAEFNWFNIQHLLPIHEFIKSGIDKEVATAIFAPSASDILVAAAATIAFVLASCLMYGAIYTQIRFYKATDSLPCSGPFSFWKEVRKDGGKVFIFDLIFYSVIALVLTPIIIAAYYLNSWIMLASIPLLIYGLVIGINGRLQYVVEQKHLKAAIADAFHTGHIKFGGYFILILLTGIPVILTAFIAFQPVALFHLASCADRIPTLAGYPSGISPEILPVHLLTATCAFFIYNMVYALQQWALALYTSAVCKK